MLIISRMEFTKEKVKLVFEDDSFLVVYKGMVDKDLDELSDEELTELTKQMTSYAKRRAMNLLVKKNYSEASLNDKLTKDGYNPAIIKAVFDFLNSYHYLDDERVATEIVRVHKGAKSINELKKLLSNQKLPDDVIEKAILEEYKSEDDDEDRESCEKQEMTVILGFLKKNGFTPEKIRALTYPERQKLAAKLYRKGFKSDNIFKALKIEEFY